MNGKLMLIISSFHFSLPRSKINKAPGQVRRQIGEGRKTFYLSAIQDVFSCPLKWGSLPFTVACVAWGRSSRTRRVLGKRWPILPHRLSRPRHPEGHTGVGVREHPRDRERVIAEGLDAEGCAACCFFQSLRTQTYEPMTPSGTL